MTKKFIFRAAAVFGVLACVVIIAEAYLRLTATESSAASRHESIMLSEHPELRYEFRPDSRSSYQGVPWESNSFGFRDRQYEITKPDGVYRIMIFGDSVMHGGDMVLEKIAAKRLEALLNQSTDALRYEVINCAVVGYDFGQAVAAFKYKGMQFEPDLVIFGYCLNDPDVVAGELEVIGEHPKLDGLKPSGLANYFHLAHLWYQQSRRYQSAMRARDRIETSLATVRDPHASSHEINSDLLSAMREHISSNKFPPETGKKNFLDYFASLHINQNRWLRVEDALKELRTLKASGDFEVMVALLPVCVQFKPYYLEPVHKFLAAQFGQAGIEVLDLYIALRNDDPNKLALNASDRIHYSEFGHQRIAEELFKAVTVNHTAE